MHLLLCSDRWCRCITVTYGTSTAIDKSVDGAESNNGQLQTKSCTRLSAPAVLDFHGRKIVVNVTGCVRFTEPSFVPFRVVRCRRVVEVRVGDVIQYVLEELRRRARGQDRSVWLNKTQSTSWVCRESHHRHTTT